MQARGELVQWIELRPLRGRLRAHLQMTSIQWATGALSDEGLKAAARYGAALIMAAASVGAARAEFEAAAREAQPEAVSRVTPPPRDTSATGSSGRRPK
jgi:alkanesulfonate monooxygenase SsuD/methylene tetrahydromethanopterin reductase-like flavin-dependent oxidoreductase (luciferase family)